MATYVMSDLHGAYDRFEEMLELINFSDDDVLYILGDILDRGPHPIKLLQKIMKMPNVISLVGNHEMMALGCLEYLFEKDDSSFREETYDMRDLLDLFYLWRENGSMTTEKEFSKLSKEEQKEIIDYIKEMSIYEELLIDGQKYLLIHAGLGKYKEGKKITDCSVIDLVETRPDYSKKYMEDTILIVGHTPTQLIEGNPNPGYIYKNNNNIVIDCGAYHGSGRLAALCLESGEEFYAQVYDGFDLLQVSEEDSGLDYDIFLLSSASINLKEDTLPHLYIDCGEEKIPVSISDNPMLLKLIDNTIIPDFDLLKEWIRKNMEVLLKHWNQEMSDREVLNRLFENDV